MTNPVQLLEASRENPPVNEALWQEWLARGKRNDTATRRKMNWIGGFAVVVLTAGFYLLTVK